MSCARVVVSVFFSVIVFFSVGCGMVDVKPPIGEPISLEGISAKIDPKGAIYLESKGEKIIPCGKQCEILNGPVVIYEITTGLLRLEGGGAIPASIVTYNPTQKRHGATATHNTSVNKSAWAAGGQACDNSGKEDNHCCSKISIVTPIGQLEFPNPYDPSCPR